MRPVHRRDVLAALGGLSSLALGAALNQAAAEPVKGLAISFTLFSVVLVSLLMVRQ